ncbi:methyl-accepting chemotaxis protein [Texcoconibacillus texcoconensis]|uniref:Methyl-accepting chemotaxis protein n=1 Tax=Texcoconibacillus texcoconensis TaxID=1095777 RepID=A0A840QRV6_9BACI|nr:methyl-accepting chemotaxis protein [Texcoconibacillus texcoconensis]MBB5174085.1 methyl-accepting chemotaxis protein [Texcoconibacillus texcoconensis]
MAEQKYRYGIRKKIVVGICVVASITYGTSAFFILVLNDFLTDLLGISEAALLLLTLAKGIFWTGLLGFIGATVFVKPLRELQSSARKVANGNITENVKVPKSDDELRGLALAYNDMVTSLREMVSDIQNNFDKTNEKVEDIKGASDLAARQSETISQTVEQIAIGADNSAHSIQNTAQSIEDVTNVAEKVQKNAQSSDQLAHQMVDTLGESEKVIQSLVNGIETLATDNETSLQAVYRLENQAKKVEEIISVVGDMAEQTNLLALNASIEAARAGEHGKGFAVVADEVRKLADQSSQSVQGISELISSIQDEVSNVVKQITAQVERANDEAKKGEKTNEAIVEINTSVEQVTQSISEILQLVDKQMSAFKQTSQDSQDVAAVAEETSAGTEEVTSSTEEQTAVMQQIAASAESLSEQANELKQTINRFSM